MVRGIKGVTNATGGRDSECLEVVTFGGLDLRWSNRDCVCEPISFLFTIN